MVDNFYQKENEFDSFDEPSMKTMRGDSSSVVLLGKIDQYEVIRKLGGGGFGVVYLVRDSLSNVNYAIKTIHPLLKNNIEEIENIRQQFFFISRLTHSHIAPPILLHPVKSVELYDEEIRRDLHVYSGDFIMILKYAPGVTLSKWTKQFPKQFVPVEKAIDICRQVASALDYAHFEGIIHRDIKPSNIMVETRGNNTAFIRVLDFGLAAEIRSSMSRVSTEQGDTSGTRPYMAPEQWQGKRQGPATDQYSLACMFYELVSGSVPFAGAFETGDVLVMLNSVSCGEVEPLPMLSKHQNNVLRKALSKKGEERFPNCSTFINSLENSVTNVSYLGQIAPNSDTAYRNICKRCNFENKPVSLFCENCGVKLEREDICTHCGAKLGMSENFCVKCGAKTPRYLAKLSKDEVQAREAQVRKFREAEEARLRAVNEQIRRAKEEEIKQKEYEEQVRKAKKEEEEAKRRAFEEHARIVREQIEKERKEKEDQERQARIEQARIAKEKREEQLRIQAEQARIVKEKREEQLRIQAEQARLAKEKREEQLRIQVEQARLAKEKREEQRKLKEKAIAERKQAKKQEKQERKANAERDKLEKKNAKKQSRVDLKRQGNSSLPRKIFKVVYACAVLSLVAFAIFTYIESKNKAKIVKTYNLGVSYTKGDSVAQNYEKAAECFLEAANQGHLESQNMLARCYDEGKGVTQNRAEAVEWYRKAAEQGLAEAQYNLGACYYNGTGVEKDYNKATEWFKKAAEQGNSFAQTSLGNWYYNGKSELQNYAEAVKWYNEAAKQDNAYAQVFLGNCYYYGKGVPQNFNSAEEWYRKAKRHNNKDINELIPNSAIK